MKLILLPSWLEKAIEASGQEPSRVVEDVQALGAILSPDDVAFYVYINACRGKLTGIGEAIDEAFDPFPIGMENLIKHNIERCVDYYESYLFGTPPDTQTVWFGEVKGVDRQEGGVSMVPGLKAEMLSYDTVAIRPFQQAPGESLRDDNMQTLKSRLLSLLYSRASFDSIANTKLFSSWLGGMRAKE